MAPLLTDGAAKAGNCDTNTNAISNVHPMNNSMHPIAMDTSQRGPIDHGAIERVITRINQGTKSLRAFNLHREEGQLQTAISNLQAALREFPPGADLKLLLHILYHFALSVEFRYGLWKDIGDIRIAIEHYQKARCLPLRQDPLYKQVIVNLTGCLRITYAQQSDVGDLKEFIECCRDVLQLLPAKHPNRSLYLLDLAGFLRIRHTQRGALEDMKEAIRCQRDALLHCPVGDPKRPPSLNDLACLLGRLHTQQGALEDIKEAIQCQRDALHLLPAEHPDQSIYLDNLAKWLFKKYMQQSDGGDLEEAIQCYRDALKLCPVEDPERPEYLNSLAVILRNRYGQHGDVVDLEEAIRYFKDELQLLPVGDPGRSSCLSNLASCLNLRHKTQGAIEDLNGSIQYQRDVLQLNSKDPRRSAWLSNLAVHLHTRYRKQGSIEDLEEAIQCHRDALQLCPAGDPSRSMFLKNNLAACLHTRYLQQGAIEDIEEEIQCYRDALQLCPVGDPQRPVYLSNLASSLMLRPHKQGSTKFEDAKVVIQHLRDALQLFPVTHPGRASCLNNLGNCLGGLCYDIWGDIEVLNEAIQFQKDAVQLCQVGHQDRSVCLNNLARSLRTRYVQQGALADLKEATACLLEAIENPYHHPTVITDSWVSLAGIYADHGQHLSPDHNASDFPSLFEKAVDNQPAGLKLRFEASLKWIKKQSGPAGLKAYQKCLELADQYLLIRPSVTSRHQLLSSIPPSLSSDAAASAIEAGDLKKAVEFLEHGRTILWSQMGRYRTPLDRLQDENPELAAKFKRLSDLLETSATSNDAGISRLTLEDQAREYRRISDDWHTTIEQIRKLEGFAGFLKAPEFANLRYAAKNGPIVIINISARRSDAIIVQMDADPLLVNLPRAHELEDRILGFASEFKGIRSGHGTVPMVHTGQIHALALILFERILSGRGTGPKVQTNKILAVLKFLWAAIVKPVAEKLQAIGIAKGSRIWWCPTSQLALLPLHAAGIYGQPKQPNLPDLYISSYTPTLSALIRPSQSTVARTNQQLSSTIPKLLVVAQPNTPGQRKLPAVYAELERIEVRVPSATVLLGETGTSQAVLTGLQNHRWMHFACHGSHDLQDPYKSSFHLHDGSLTLLDIVQANLPNAEYAFLSACHSAAGDSERPDEAIHLAAGLQFSGFRSVIGTMYAMSDEDGPTVAEEVYKYMFRHVGTGNLKPDVDYRDAAKALNIAIKIMREKEVPVERWINFVHIGT